MYPVTTIKDLPEAFNKLEIPNFIQIDPEEININKEKWIDEWLNASQINCIINIIIQYYFFLD